MFVVRLPHTLLLPDRDQDTPENPHLPLQHGWAYLPAGSWPPNLLAGVIVLVVDDEPDARQLIKRVLELSQAKVQTASSVGEALELIALRRPDVLLSDIGMPVRDGHDLIRELRLRHDAKGIPAIALTAFASVEDRQRALSAGFQVHVAKPINPQELTLAVASLVGRAGNGTSIEQSTVVDPPKFDGR